MTLVAGNNKYTQQQIDQVKRNIRMLDLAFLNGYKLLEPGRWPKIVGPGGYKIVTRIDETSGDSYFTAGEKGDIIRFYRNHICPGASFGEAMEYLTCVAGIHVHGVVTRRIKPKTKLNVEQVTAMWKQLSDYRGSYLVQARRLDAGTVRVFRDHIRQDGYGNACFPHRSRYDEPKVVGYEKKNWRFHGFLARGERLLFMARPDGETGKITLILVCEAAIDALSYYELHHRQGTLYVSTAGSLKEDTQVPLIAGMAREWWATVVAAQDNDPQGERMASKLAAAIPSSLFKRAKPRLKDWNDVLKEKKARHAKN